MPSGPSISKEFQSMVSRLLHSVGRQARFQKVKFRDEVHGLIDRAYFKEREGVCTEKRKIIFHCTVWGDDYLHSFFSYTVPSLLQDGNIPTLARDGYVLGFTIYTHPQEYQEVAKQYGPCLALLNEHMTVSVIPLNELKTGGWRGDYWHYVTSAMVDQIKRCIDEDAIMFSITPDTIYGNRSITNAVRTVQGKNVCLAAAHPRLSKESILMSDVFAGLKRMERSFENDELVDIAFEHGHQTLLGSFDNEEPNMTHGGTSIRKINNSTYSVVHNLPMVWLANFVKDDLKFFESAGHYWDDRWDHRWPRLLLRQNRLKVVGSSDLFFCVEPTADDQRVWTMKRGLLNNDKFDTRRRRYLHNYVCNSFCCVWRGRGDVRRFSSVE
jgi:hypothetical protein